MIKIVAAVLVGILMLHVMIVPSKAASTTKSSCVGPQFSIVLKSASAVKGKSRSK